MGEPERCDALRLRTGAVLGMALWCTLSCAALPREEPSGERGDEQRQARPCPVHLAPTLPPLVTADVGQA
jgi:hypothetical protein